MLGSIIGDIVGSIYEFNNIKTKVFPFFCEEMEYTDDSVLTVATADWLLSDSGPAQFYAEYAHRYPNPMGSYGGGFKKWAISVEREGIMRPYNSCGNGSAMRIGPVGWAFDKLEETLAKAKESSECTHNHPEGIIGAQAVAMCIFMARNGSTKEEIQKEVETRFGYDFSFTVEDLQKDYSWNSKWGNGGLCQCSVPQAIRCFLDGKDFEDSIRNAISIGGDSDTIGCITGSIAEAYFSIPQEIYDKGLSYLDKELSDTVKDFEAKFGKKVIG